MRKAQKELPAGFYEYVVSPTEEEYLTLFNGRIDLEQLNYCFNDAGELFGSSVQIIITADLARQPAKYSNRGYRFTLIEVGHVAENISLHCAKNGLGCLELGGILDEPLKELLELPDETFPLLGIAVGYERKKPVPVFNKLAFVENLPSTLGVGFSERSVRALGEDAPFFGASVRFGKDPDDVAGATSTSDQDAVFKATMEAYERYFASRACGEIFTANELHNYLDPYDIVPMTDEQISRLGVSRFTSDLPISWVQGKELCSNRKIYVPTDLVYYGHQSEGNRIYYGSSSGMAAHLQRESAIDGALIELIERDAFMRAWHAKTSPSIISDEALSMHALNRRKYWQSKGRELKIVLFPSHYANVVGALIRGNEYPCFVIGTSATLSADLSKAINKAIQEAEYSFVCYSSEKPQPLDKHDIWTPHQHGQYYCAPENAKALDWLFDEKCLADGPDDIYRMELLQKLKPIVVDILTEPISIVRVISRKLVPISFGYELTHFTHRGILLLDENSLNMPHCFA